MIADQISLINNLIPKSVQFVFHIEGISKLSILCASIFTPVCFVLNLMCVQGKF